MRYLICLLLLTSPALAGRFDPFADTKPVSYDPFADCKCGCDCGCVETGSCTCQSCPENCLNCSSGSRERQQTVSAPVRVYYDQGYTRYTPAPVYYYPPLMQVPSVAKFQQVSPIRWVPAATGVPMRVIVRPDSQPVQVQRPTVRVVNCPPSG